ncbi:3-dehydroquinate synthase isoform X2 [Tasmannia lanceolata]|uniref:3-dehydroquinate synthase isoform X2 n=1 Tax=Tasmannia lanceolata TaxID=3420 RepID=UPI004062AAF1
MTIYLHLFQIPIPSKIRSKRGMAMLSSLVPGNLTQLSSVACTRGNSCRGVYFATLLNSKRAELQLNSHIAMASAKTFENFQQQKLVWLWTKSKQVMTAAVERGWNTFIFMSRDRELANEWSSIALINPLFVEDDKLFNSENKRVATFSEVSSPQQLQQLQPSDEQAENVVINLLDWQVIPAENIVAAFQGSQKTVFAVAKTPSEAQVFLEALEQGLGGVVLKVEDVEAILELKDYFDRRNEVGNLLNLTEAIVTRVQMAGMGDRVCVDLCSLMRPGEGLLVGSFARGLFLVHSECLESNYIASRPFRVNALNYGGFELPFEASISSKKFKDILKDLMLVASLQGPVHSYVAIPGGKTCYLSELQAGKEVIVVNQNGLQRTAIVGRVKIESRPLILVEAKKDSDYTDTYSILLQNAETVGLVHPCEGDKPIKSAIPVTSLKVGDKVLLRMQGGARHTGIEIQEFIVEK